MNLPLGAWIFLSVIAAACIGVGAWMVSAGYLPAAAFWPVLSPLLVAVVAWITHQLAVAATLATPSSSSSSAPAPAAVPKVAAVPPSA